MNEKIEIAKTLYDQGYFDALNHVYYNVEYAEKLEHSREYKRGVTAGERELKRRKMVKLLIRQMDE